MTGFYRNYPVDQSTIRIIEQGDFWVNLNVSRMMRWECSMHFLLYQNHEAVAAEEFNVTLHLLDHDVLTERTAQLEFPEPGEVVARVDIPETLQEIAAEVEVRVGSMDLRAIVPIPAQKILDAARRSDTGR